MGLKPEQIAKAGDEYSHQCAVFAQAALDGLNNPEFRTALKWMYAIKNAGHGDTIRGARNKAEGVKKGVSDICLPYNNGIYCGLYIELKVGKNKPSDDQLAFGEYVIGQGYKFEVAYGWVEAVKHYRRYLGIKVNS